MLIRCTVDLSRTVRGGRQSWPQYCIVAKEVALDPWENDDVADCISNVFGITHVDVDGWTRVAGSLPFLPDEQQPVRIAEDTQAGYIYYRRPIDIERQQLWNRDHSFRISKSEW